MITLEHLQTIDDRKLEQESIEAYRRIAQEYYDPRHQTCRAFDYLDEHIVRLYQQKYGLLKGGSQYLEVGGGMATLLRSALPSDASVIVGDLTSEMARHAPPLPGNMSYRQFSAFHLPFAGEQFDGVLGFLADSYNVTLFYKEACRVLRPGGFVLVTCPTKLWASTLRCGAGESFQHARFTTQSGDVVLIPSITWSEEEYEELLASAGITMVLYEEFCLPVGFPSHRIPETICGPAQLLRMEASQLPLVAAVMGRK